jgi:hypothetical protein
MMRILRAIRPALVLLALLGPAGCAERPTSDPPSPGPLDVVLHTDVVGARAMLLEIRGPAAIATPQAAPGYIVHSRADGTTRHVAVFGELRPGALLTLAVPDTRRAEDYAVAAVETADAENRILPAGTGITLTVERRGN